jgi:hypothetical protein
MYITSAKSVNLFLFISRKKKDENFPCLNIDPQQINLGFCSAQILKNVKGSDTMAKCARRFPWRHTTGE